MKHQILIIDDEESIRSIVSDVFTDEGYTVWCAETIIKGKAVLQRHAIDLLFLDIWLGADNGLEYIAELKQKYPALEILIISGHGNIDVAVDATKRGAYDFIEKPLSIERILLAAKNALYAKDLSTENKRLKQRIEKDELIIGNTKEIAQVRKLIDQAAASDVRVLVTGENGTGKELVARSIHNKSERISGPFIPINSASIPTNLMESELFGHEKGAFTGAHREKKGKLLLANDGTLFLDEIGDMDVVIQAKLLRVLEDMRFTPVGSLTETAINARIIAATNKDLTAEIKKGCFREDLFYRLNVLPIHLPPLRQRKNDIPMLSKHFMDDFFTHHKFSRICIDDDALEVLKNYQWPGNVRELRNIVERTIAICQHDVITVTDVETSLAMQSGKQDIWDGQSSFTGKTLKEIKETAEKSAIKEAIKRNQGNISQTARELKIERSNLYKKINQFGISMKEIEK